MAEALNQDVRLFKAQTKDGSKVTYKVSWQGYADMNVHEDGGPSTFTHPIDDRRCSWNISGYIMRRVAVVVAGQDYWNDSISKVFDSAHGGEGSPFVLLNLHPENCNDCRDRRDSDYNDMKNRVNGSLKAVADADVQDVIAAIKGLPGMVDVNV